MRPASAPIRPASRTLRYNDVAALEAEFATHGAEICAVILEPMQGEGGMTPGTPEYLQAARRLCTAHGALLILDEIQSGMGRTGALFSYMQKGIVPDILTSAKGLGGGFPIGAMLTTDRVASAFSVGVHGTTYGGNPLACAVAGAVFDVINTTEVLDGVKARHALFIEGLRAINARRRVFRDLRGEGVWLGCELDEPWRGKSVDVMNAAGEAGLLLLVAGPDVVRIAPSLVISLDEILEGLARLETALNRALVRSVDACSSSGRSRATTCRSCSRCPSAPARDSRRCPPIAIGCCSASSARSRRSRATPTRRDACYMFVLVEGATAPTSASSASARSKRRSG